MRRDKAKHCFAPTQGESYARVEREFKRVWGLDRQDNCGLIITVRLRNQNLPSLTVQIWRQGEQAIIVTALQKSYDLDEYHKTI